MDNFGFRRDGEVSAQININTDDVCDGVETPVVKEVVKKELVPEKESRSSNGDQKNDDTDGLRKTNIAENPKESPARINTGIISRETENENLLIKQADTECELRERPISSQKDFSDTFVVSEQPAPTVRQVLDKKWSKWKCSGPCLKGTLYSTFPCINILRNYNIRRDIMGDIVAGLTVGIMHIPQGMAYAMLATLSPVYGLYTSFFPLLVYFFLGSSRHVSLGTASVVCLMIGSSVTKGIESLSTNGLVTYSSNNQTDSEIGNQSEATTAADVTSDMSPEELDLRLQFAMSVTFMIGVIQLLMATFRLGFITEFLSDALISGFTTGVACHVFTSQITNIFSIKLPRYSGVFKLIYIYRDFFLKIGTTNYFTVVLSVASAVILYCTSRFINQNPKLKPKMFMPVPIELIVVVLGTVFSYAFNLEEKFSVAVVSDIPTGLPVPNTKGFSRISGTIIQDAFPIVIVIFSISISISKLLAKKHNYEVDPNQELLAFGVSSVVCSFLSSVAPMAALSRAVVQERVGGNTQVAGLVSSCLLLVVLLAVGKYFKTTPKCVLAAVIVVALRGMLSQVFDLKKIYDVSKINFFVWIVAFLSTLILDVDLGLGVAVAFNLLMVLYRVQRPQACLLGKMPGTDLYRNINVYPQAKEVPGIKIFRFEQSLFFLNKEYFRSLLSKNTVNPTALAQKRAKNQYKCEKEVLLNGTVSSLNEDEVVKSKDHSKENIQENQAGVDFHIIIIDCSCWSFVDTMGVTCLTAVIGDYREAGIKVLLASCNDGVRETFKKTKFDDILDHSSIYVSVHAAVSDSLGTRDSVNTKEAYKGSSTKTAKADECCVDINDESLQKIQEKNETLTARL